MLTTGQREMCRPVEIEFAGTIDRSGQGSKGHLYWLQIRPIVDRKELVDEHLLELPDDRLIMRSDTALGHGTIDSVSKIVYVRPEKFSSSNNPFIAREIEKINRQMTADGDNYILVGPGRWGSSDTARYSREMAADRISTAHRGVGRGRLSCGAEPRHTFLPESDFVRRRIFHDRSGIGQRFFNVGILDSMKADLETEFVRVVTFPSPLAIGINGKKGIGVVALPPTDSQSQ